MTKYIITGLSNKENYLEHYGVLGMRWGHRKAQKLLLKADKARRSGNLSEYRQYQSKSKALNKKHMERAGGRKSYDYSIKQSTGKTIAKTMLFGTYGTLRYNEARANGYERGKSAVLAALASSANSLTGGGLSFVEPRLRESKNQ